LHPREKTKKKSRKLVTFDNTGKKKNTAYPKPKNPWVAQVKSYLENPSSLTKKNRTFRE